MNITRTWLEDQIGEDILESGEACFLHRQVHQMEVLDQGHIINGEVEDGEHRYSAYIEIDAHGIDGDCSCPTGYNCEHIAALLLAMLDDQCASPVNSGVPVPPADIQGKQHDDGITGELTLNEYPADVHQRILYILSPGFKGFVYVNIVAARRLNGGSYGATSTYLLQNFSSHIQHRFILPIDRSIIQHIDEATAHNSTFLPKGEQGAILTTLMLKTGRCHWLDASNPPLTPGEARKGTWFWQEDENARQTLCLRVPDAQSEPGLASASMLIPSSPPFYIDKCGEQGGRITTGCPDELYESLLFFLSVHPKKYWVMNELSFAWPAGVPEPKQLHIRRVNVTPRPVLRLLFNAEEKYLNGIRLLFDYGGHLIMPAHYINETTYYQQEGQWFETSCDRELERAFIRQLYDAGLRRYSHPGNLRKNPDIVPEWFLPRNMGWPEFLASRLAPLQQAGFRIEYAPGFRYEIVQVRRWNLDCREHGIMGEIHFEVVLEDGLHLDLIDVIASWVNAQPDRLSDTSLDGLLTSKIQHLPLPDGRILPVTGKMLHGMLTAMLDIFSAENSKRNIAAMGWLHLRDRLADNPYVHFRDNAVWLERMRQLVDMRDIPAVTPPQGLTVSLRNYQQYGLNWLQSLRRLRLGALLADDMGLGKTIQTLAHILKEKETGALQQPALVVAPTSLLHNWKAEANRFAPELRVRIWHGAGRSQQPEMLEDCDLAVTTYSLLARDVGLLLQRHWSMLILDEAQYIRNSRTLTARMARALEADQRICLTGTPMENHLGELWSLFDFLMPGYLHDIRSFTRIFRRPIEREGSSVRQAQLNLRLRPFMLRRCKTEVARELPAKTEIIRTVDMDSAQRALYEGIRLAMHEKVHHAMQRLGKGQSHIMVLVALLKMRQACCDPRLLRPSPQDHGAAGHSGITQASIDRAGSAKLDCLREMLPEMIAEGRRILLFSQFTRMLELIALACDEMGIAYVTLTGATRNRSAVVDAFQNHQAPLFLISLKAGGAGLNLTAADTVIHYDPWWNPAAEAQASDRAHRIGQDKPVFVYKLVAEGSVEARILDMQARKQTLADALYDGVGKAAPLWSDEELEALFAPMDDEP
ncbi:MAG: DEAD/DEAH box helicase [Mariprofundaceae bacterium]|nr:DEAD/DEAH box helicase [Mariprofundaceae bacterium]